MSLELAVVAPHTPRICHEDKAPDFQRPMIEAMHRAATHIASTKPDVLVLVSCHWVASFNHYIDATPVHAGVLTAEECPDMISGVHYRFPGDPEIARDIAENARSKGLQMFDLDDPTYVWDYGSVVPMRYLNPDASVRVVNLSVCLAADLKETRRLGQAIGEVLQKSSRRAVFVASGAVAHHLVRGPDICPDQVDQALEDLFCERLVAGEINIAQANLPAIARDAGVESGGRHLATLVGAIEGSGRAFRGEKLGWGQSSGSGNPVIVLWPNTGTSNGR